MEEKVNAIQDLAVQSWLNASKKSTIEAITGIGKTFIFIKCTQYLKKNSKILFLAETTLREEVLYEEIKKFKKLFKYDLLKYHKLEFKTYQSAHKLKGQHYDMVCADEAHDSFSPIYAKFYFNNTYDSILCLSATIEDTKYEGINGLIYTKKDIMNIIAPISYTYKIEDGQRDGTGRKLNIYMVENQLDDKKNILVKFKKCKFYTSELEKYNKLNESIEKANEDTNYIRKSKKIRYLTSQRANLLYNINSKILLINKLLNQINGKSIVFGNSIDSLLLITDNTVCSRNSKTKNQEIIDSFNKGTIKTIASFKQLKQGANLNCIDNVILHSYYGIEKDFIQRIGRARRNITEESANIYIIVTKDTQEEVWFRKMLEAYPNAEIKKLKYDHNNRFKEV